MAKILLVLLATFSLSSCQTFHPTLSDGEYLDQIDKEIGTEVEDAELEFLDQAKIVENSTQRFIVSKLRENAFRALRLMAEKEMKNLPLISGPRLKSPKQGDDVELSGLENAVEVNKQVFEMLRLVPLIPSSIMSFLRDAFKIVFPTNNGTMTTDVTKGQKVRGNNNIISRAEILLNEPQDIQLLGIASLIAENQLTKLEGSQGLDRFNRRRVDGDQAKFLKLAFMKEFRKSFKQLDEKSAAIYGGVQEAYYFLNRLRGAAHRIALAQESSKNTEN